MRKTVAVCIVCVGMLMASTDARAREAPTSNRSESTVRHRADPLDGIGYLSSGVSLMALGFLGYSASLAFVVSGVHAENHADPEAETMSPFVEYMAGMTALWTGLLLTSIGTPLMAVGIRKRMRLKRNASRPAVAFAVWHAPGGGRTGVVTLGWRF